MANQFGIFFRVFHPTLSKQRLAEEMGVIPTVSWSVGDPRLSVRGDPLGGTRKESFATFDIVPFGAPDLAARSADVARFIGTSQAFISQVGREGGRCEVYVSGMICATWGDVIHSDLLRLMGQFGIALLLDVLPIADESEGQPNA